MEFDHKLRWNFVYIKTVILNYLHALVKVYEVMLCIPVFQSIQRFATGRLASKGPVSLSTRSYTCWPMETQLRNSWKNILHSNGRIFLLVLTTQHREELHHGILIVRLKQPNRHKIHERVMQAMALFAAEEWCDSLVVMWDVMKSVWRNGGRS